MLWTITVILFVLWILGMVSGATMGWWIHILLVLAVISLILAVIRRGGGATI
ncbi:MAG TPA: lmo0937 family membrane protein [Myxococcaceae bacterium]|nr:lmo0937 family membrane protein [Myxococcaceae bacterium]